MTTPTCGGQRERAWPLPPHEWLILHSTTMTSVHDPMETASMHTSPPATDHDIIDVEEPYDNGDSDASLEVSDGGDLRVRIFLLLPAASQFITSGNFRMTSRMSSKETSSSGGNSPSARLSP